MFINEVHLINFRNHGNFKLQAATSTNFIVGPNGSGKTSILEAISLLTTARGFRSAALTDLTRRDPHQNSAIDWAVRLSFTDHDFTITPAINDNVHNVESAARQKKTMKCNGAAITSRHELIEEVRIVWLAPEMIQQFFLTASARRDFFDKLADDNTPGHIKLIRQYRQLNSSRLRLLREAPDSHRWIETLEWQMMELAEKIHTNRQELLAVLAHSLSDFGWESYPKLGFTPKHFYNTANFCREQYMFHVKHSRKKDGIVGRATFGINLDDFELHHSLRGIDSKNCSSGEKQGMLIRIFLAHIRHLSMQEATVIALLDDIFAHLDEENIALLSQSIVAIAGMQTWITLTDKDLHNMKQHLDIEKTRVVRL